MLPRKEGGKMVKLGTVFSFFIGISFININAWGQADLSKYESIFTEMRHASEPLKKSLISRNVHTWGYVEPQDLPVASPKGYTYLVNQTFPVEGAKDCDLVFKQIDEALEDNLFYDGPLFGTSFMHCRTDQEEHPLELFVHVGVEPRSEADIPVFNEYLSRVQAKQVIGGKIQFQRIEQIIARTALQATMVWNPPPNEAIMHEAPKFDAFYNLGSFYTYQRDNREFFWKPIDELLKWVELKWNYSIRRFFEIYALTRANSMMLDYERIYRLEDGSLVKNWLIEVKLFRDCRKNPNMKCI
jgi:hypothetical protein